MRNWRVRRLANGKDATPPAVTARIRQLWPAMLPDEIAAVVEGTLK
jgi:hypothetical protein